MSALLHPHRWALRTKLVAWMILLFVVVTFATGLLTVRQLGATMRSQVDDSLHTAMLGMAGNSHLGGGALGAGAPGGEGTLSVDLNISTNEPVTYVTSDGQTVTRATISGAGFTQTQLSATDITELKDASIGNTPKTVFLSGHGDYRVIAVRRIVQLQVIDTQTLIPSTISVNVITITGLPVGYVDNTVNRTALSIALLSGSGVILVAMLATWVIRRNLDPLSRVAATATRVSKLPLDTGEVSMAERVPAQYTDPNTEVGQVGAALNDMLDHVGEALTARHESEQQVRQFVADASHELRTPLSSIRGYAELSRRETEPVPETVTHALARIESEAGRMSSLVEDLLLLARLDAGRPLDRKPVELPLLLIETVSDLQAAGPDHQWQLDLPEDALEIEGDEARIRQVLINLLANARRHTPKGTTVTAGLRQQDGGALITVTDNGPGIPPALLPHIFERFARGDSARTRTEGSTGLGLSIVHAVVSAHHGRIHVDSVPGATSFAIWLPARQPAATAAVVPA